MVSSRFESGELEVLHPLGRQSAEHALAFIGKTPVMLDPQSAVAHTASIWRRSIEPALADYIRVPALSVAFDPDWEAHGHLARVVAEAADWAKSRDVAGLSVEVVALPGRSPVLCFEVAAFGTHARSQETVLLYGHLDKQPPMTGWRDGLGPWEPVVIDDRLYGRGGADDGYALYGSIAAIEAVQAGGGSHARLFGIIETGEESGSPDLPAYVEHLADKIGNATLVICLDSFCGDYERLWTTTSLRGLLDVDLTVAVLSEGIHSGSASGVVPDTFRILRQLLDRIEDAASGRLLVPELWAPVPHGREVEIAGVAADLGSALTANYPLLDGVRPAIPAARAGDQLRAKTWEPTLTVIGADGLPTVRDAGNVLRPFTTVSLSFRLPPTVDAHAAGRAVAQVLCADPPYGARVTAAVPSAESGWDAPATEPWLKAAMDEASHAGWGQPARSLGEGGSIPFMGMLGQRFPAAQFLLTGVLGPGSNAHGPNEFLHLPTGRKVTASVAITLDRHARR